MQWLLLSLLLMTDPPAQNQEPGAKAMFRDPSLGTLSFSPRAEPQRREPTPKPKEKKPHQRPVPPTNQDREAEGTKPERDSIGIRFWVERVDESGKVQDEVDVGHIFRSGDQVQLVIESNSDGYLAIVQQGSNGKAGLLIPQHESRIGENPVSAHDKVVLPGAGHVFTFDRNPGTERLMIVLARDRKELDTLPLRSEMKPEDIAALRRLAAQGQGSKNLVIERVANPQADPCTYVVSRTGSVIIQEIALVHEE